MFNRKKKEEAKKKLHPEEVGGSLQISNNVIADLAGYAAMTCYGVVGMANTDNPQSITELLPLHPTRKGIEVKDEDGTLVVTLHVIIDAGTKLAEVSKNLKDGVDFILKECAQVENLDVRVVIEGIKYPQGINSFIESMSK